MCKITIELVPQSVWQKNLRSMLPKKDWDILRRDCYKHADYECEICGGVGPKHPVECHEIWEFDDERRIQFLTGLIALCPTCHMVKHIGFATVSGKRHLALHQLCKVNGWDENQADDYIAECFQVWNDRSEEEWTTNIDWAYQMLK